MCERLKPDYLIHTKYHPFIQQATDAAGIRYMPALGTSINGLLHGEIDAMVEEAKTVAATGVYGVKVSAYRYVGDSQALVEALMHSIHCPLCATGSVDSFSRIQVLKDSGVALFTIGSALFNHKFGDGFAQQIQAISAFLNQ